jgi:stage II sporulation SpoE-like protein/GAF domain-containing protein
MTAQDELERLDALHQLEIMDTPREERFDRVVRLAQRLFDVPMVAISLLDENRQWHKAQVGFEFQQTPRTDAFCNRTIQSSGPFVVTDASQDSVYRTNPLVVDKPSIRFYAGQPLAAPGGQLVGTLCILDDKPREVTSGELGLLRDLADWVEKELAIDQELLRASEVQKRLLPASAPDVPGYQIAGRCRPARQVGGDFFDWYRLGDQLQFVVADVMGKGVAAAIIGASVRALLRGASRFNDVGEAVNRTAFTLEQDLLETSSFATLFCARLDPSSHRLAYVDAGHGLSVVLEATGGVRRLAADGLPLGASFGEPLTVHEEQLQPGDTLLSVSDGFLDFFPDVRSALEVARRLHGQNPDAGALVEAIDRFAGTASPPDDITVVAVRRAE